MASPATMLVEGSRARRTRRPEMEGRGRRSIEAAPGACPDDPKRKGGWRAGEATKPRPAAGGPLRIVRNKKEGPRSRGESERTIRETTLYKEHPVLKAQ